jgi:uncharacterized membrane protein YeiB
MTALLIAAVVCSMSTVLLELTNIQKHDLSDSDTLVAAIITAIIAGTPFTYLVLTLFGVGVGVMV